MIPAWTEHAACANGRYAADLTSADPAVALAAARRVCPGCPVVAECRAYGDSLVHVEGVWGGEFLRREHDGHRSRKVRRIDTAGPEEGVPDADEWWTEEAARTAHAAYRRGERNPWVNVGHRVWERRQKRAERLSKGVAS